MTTQGPPDLPSDDSFEALPADEPAADEPPETLSAVCPNCGAQSYYVAGTRVLRCESCGSEREFEQTRTEVREHSFDDWQAANRQTLVANVAAFEMRCQQCGASETTTQRATRCQFCGGALIAVDTPDGLVEPEAVIPFHVDSSAARTAFLAWLRSRRFAPNALKEVGSAEGLKGTYLPHWTFDAHTETDYTGRRGDHYYTTHTRTVSDGKGGTRTETYQRQHTRWRHASGHVSRGFDDVLVLASHALDSEKVVKMNSWDLAESQPYQPEYLTGYAAIRYDVDPGQGAAIARGQMHGVIERDVRRDIGGDVQRIHDMDVSYYNAMFKLVLMPLWIATYLYGGKTWQVMVNAKTGEVVGDRPYSKVKIALAVLVGLLVVGGIAAAYFLSRSG